MLVNVPIRMGVVGHDAGFPALRAANLEQDRVLDRPRAGAAVDDLHVVGPCNRVDALAILVHAAQLIGGSSGPSPVETSEDVRILGTMSNKGVQAMQEALDQHRELVKQKAEISASEEATTEKLRDALNAPISTDELPRLVQLIGEVQLTNRADIRQLDDRLDLLTERFMELEIELRKASP